MARKYHIWLFVAAVVLIPISVFGIVQLLENKYQPLPVIKNDGKAPVKFLLSNQHGSIITQDDWKGKLVVANFFFTHCPSVCPKMTYNLRRIQAYSGVKGLSINSFTVDPERDSVGQLAAFAEKMALKGDWNLLTGTKQELYRIARKDLMITATDGDGGPQDFIHSENLVLIDKKLRIRGYYDGTDEKAVNKLIQDLKKLSKEE